MTERCKMVASTKRYRDFIRRSLSARPPRMAYVGGFFGHDNLGDEALYDAAELLFEGCSMLKFPRKPWLAGIARLLPRIDCAILGGGTLINQIESWRRLAQRCFNIFELSFVFGSGVADPSFWSSQDGWKDSLREWKSILAECSYVGVRGPLSAQLLADAGLDGVEVVGDPVLVFAADRPPENGSVVPDSIGLNIGQAGGHMWGTEDRVLNESIKLAVLAGKAGWQVKWFVVYPPDLSITQKAAELSGTGGEIYEVYGDVTKYLKLVRPLSTFVGMKLHATALATCACVPSVMLEYRPKCRDYMKSIGQDEAALRTDRFRAEEVWEVISAWNSQRQKASGVLFGAVKQLSDLQKSRAKELLATIEERKGT